MHSAILFPSLYGLLDSPHPYPTALVTCSRPGSLPRLNLESLHQGQHYHLRHTLQAFYTFARSQMSFDKYHFLPFPTVAFLPLVYLSMAPAGGNNGREHTKGDRRDIHLLCVCVCVCVYVSFCSSMIPTKENQSNGIFFRKKGLREKIGI